MSNVLPPADLRDEELRLALVMNGGVSLAVWMGGVAFEFNRLVGETHPVYQGLLQLTRTRARIDVISGTSAGGINGAALALGSVFDTSLWPLREVWLSNGSFDSLLRDPAETTPISLLNGDGVFLPALENAFEKLIRSNGGQPAPVTDVPMDLMLTTTLLRGEPQARLDDLGEQVEDANHRARFHFRRSMHMEMPKARIASAPNPPTRTGAGKKIGKDDDPFVRPKVALELAQAARASASFPVAFEPRWVSARTPNLESVNGKQAKPLAFARFVIDGGVLDNKPIEGALQAIFQLPPRTNVRRVLAYVTPDPAGSARAENDSPKSPPTLVEVALASLITIKNAESITDQLQLIDESNANVRHRRETLAGLVCKLKPAQIDAMATDLFPLYRERRIEGLIDYVIQQVELGVAREPSPPTSRGFGNRAREWLKATWRASADAEKYWEARIPNIADRWTYTLGAAPDHWAWGRFPLDNACRLTLELLRRTQRLRHLTHSMREVKTELDPVPDVDWETHDATWRSHRVSARQAQVQTDPLLGDAWKDAYGVQAWLAADREGGEENFAREILGLAPTLAGIGVDAEHEASARDWLYRRLVENPDDAPQKSLANRRMRRMTRYAELAKSIVELLKKLDAPIREIVGAARNERADVLKAVEELKCLHAFLFEARSKSDGVLTNELLMQRVLHLEVVIFAVLGQEAEPSAFVELVQVSARGASPWGGAAEPAEKLAGMQLANFGAFYRKSWRANDWMVGRLDAIGRLVRVVLNPDRLHRLYCRGSDPVGQVVKVLYELAVTSAGPNVGPEMEVQWKQAAGNLADELAFLARTDVRVPETLPVACELLVRRLHLEVLCRELPDIAHAVEDDLLAGARSDGPSAKLAQQIDRAQSPVWKLARLVVGMTPGTRTAGTLAALASGQALKRLDAAEAVRIYTDPDYRIGKERVEQEVGTDRMTRTATRTIVVALAALASPKSGLMLVAKLLKPLRFPTRVLHLLSDSLMHDSRTSAAITAALLVCGVLLVIGAGLFKAPENAPAGLAEIGWALLLAWTATALLRRRLAVWLALVLAAALLGVFVGVDKTLVPLTAVAALLWVMTWGLWLGPVLLALALIWWSSGTPSCADLLVAASEGGWAKVVNTLVDSLPSGTCALQDGNAGQGVLMWRLLFPLAGVTVLAMLARLGDVPNGKRALAKVKAARGGVSGWLRELLRKDE